MIARWLIAAGASLLVTLCADAGTKYYSMPPAWRRAAPASGSGAASWTDTNGPLTCLKFSYLSATTNFLDPYGSGRSGTTSSKTAVKVAGTNQNGRVSYYYSLTGSQNIIVEGTSDTTWLNNQGDNWTVCFWARNYVRSDLKCITSYAGRWFELWDRYTGGGQYLAIVNNGSAAFFTNGVETSSAWTHHAIYLYAGGADPSGRLYTNGVLASVRASTYNGNANNQSGKYYIGQYYGGSYNATGDFYDFRVYNKTLPLSAVTNLIQNTNPTNDIESF